MGIYRVQLATLDTVTRGAVDGYQDYSCRRGATLTAGGTYTLRVTTNSQADENVVAWVDFNADGVFSSAERIAYSLAARQHTSTFTVPMGAVLNQPVRLRIAADYVNAPVPTACSTPQYSQTEDYQVRVISGMLAPVARFATQDSVSCGASVTFQDASRNSPTTWQWYFGDGGTSTQQHPTHQYAAAGTYTVRLRVCNASGCDSLVRANYVTVQAGGPRPAACTPATTAYCCGYGITRVQLGSIDRRSADGQAGYEDASCASRTTLTTDQRYVLRLTTGGSLPHDIRVYLDMNDDGQFTGPQELLYQGTGLQNPAIPLLIPAAVAPVLNQPLRLRILADAVGSGATTACSNPQAGQVEDYSVVLVANTAAPTAAFQVQYRQFCGPVRVDFANTTTGGSTSAHWDFGDGTSSTAAQPTTHTYTTPGVYDVALIARNAFGTDTSWHQVVVPQACPTYCASGGVGGTPSTPVYFRSFQLGAIRNSSVRAARVGYFDFTSQHTTLYAGHTYTGQATSEPWTFAGSGPWMKATLWIDYNQDGQFGPSEMTGPVTTLSPHIFAVRVPATARPGATRLRICLQDKNAVLNEDGCSPAYRIGTTEDYTVLIMPDTAAPVAGFRADLTLACNPTVQLRDTSLAGPTSWLWQFGDGATSTQQHPQHTYAQPGTYPVTLQVRNRLGSHTLTRPNYLTVTAPAPGPRPAACLPPPGTTEAGRGIGRFTIGTTFSYSQPENAPGYQDETCRVAPLIVAPGVQYPMQLHNLYPPDALAFLWLDANDDGQFDPVTELVYNALAYPATGQPRTGTFTLPAGTLLERPLRLRANFYGWGDLTTVPSPCHRDERIGQVRDFTVVARALPTSTKSAVRPLWQLYPVPATGDVHLSGAFATPTTVTVWDAVGRCVFTTRLAPTASPTTTLRLGHLPKGVYSLRIAEHNQPLRCVLE